MEKATFLLLFSAIQSVGDIKVKKRTERGPPPLGSAALTVQKPQIAKTDVRPQV
jgi:hypothetical protein